MVSSINLAQIHFRLCEIFQNFTIPFGGQNLLLLGDLLQVNKLNNLFFLSVRFYKFKLPPVKANYIFQPLSKNDIEQAFGTIPLSFDFWNLFSYYELTQSMRQKDDNEFFNLLNRIRIGLPSIEDINLLEKRKIPILDNFNKIREASVFYCEKLKEEHEIICLLAKCSQANEFNNHVSKLLKINTVKIIAEDSNNKFKLKINRTKKNVQDTAGLEEVLDIGINSRIMLRKNIIFNKGLVNGALGYVKKLNKNVNNYINSIEILFDGHENSITLERYSAQFEAKRNFYITRKQFPICLAWGMTIHKSQGLSLKCVLIDLGM